MATPASTHEEGPAAPAPGGGGTLAPVSTVALHRPSGRAGLGLALSLTTVVLWGTLPIGLKVALAGFDALTLTWYRFVAATLVLGAILLARGSLARPRVLGRHGAWLLAVATICLAGNYILYVVGLDRTNASTTQVVIQLAPVLLALGGAWVFKEAFGLGRWLGLALMTAGLLVFSHDQVRAMISGLDLYYTGVGCVVAAAVSWAAYGLAQKQLLKFMPSPSIMLYIYAGSALLFAPLASPSRALVASPAQLAALAFCVANMLLAYAAFAEALNHWEASRVSAVLALVPLATLSIANRLQEVMPQLLEPEPITAVGVGGASMVVAGAMMMALGKA